MNDIMHYNGAFLNGKRHGPGTIFDFDDLGRSGNFINGRCIGLSTQRLSDGSTFTAVFNKDFVIAGSTYQYNPMGGLDHVFTGIFNQRMNKEAWTKFLPTPNYSVRYLY